MNRCAGKGAPKLVAVGSLRHGDDCVCDGCADVGAHNYGHRHADVENCVFCDEQLLLNRLLNVAYAALGRDSLPLATIVTTMLVDVDDDCIKTVATTPIMRPQMGLFSKWLS